MPCAPPYAAPRERAPSRAARSRSLRSCAWALCALIPACASAPERAREPQREPAERASEIVAVVDGRELAREDFADYVLRMVGPNWLEDFVRRDLLIAEAERLALAPAPEEVDRESARLFELHVAERFGGDREAFAAELAAEGQTPAGYAAYYRERVYRQMLQKRLALASRELAPEKVRERFERDYGPGGVHSEVRHIVITRARYRMEQAQQGVPEEQLTAAKLEAALAALGDTLAAELRAGADFAALARRFSHDARAAQTGGALEGSDFLRYGPEFARAVEAAEVGSIGGPVLTPTSMHVFEVTGRTSTRFEDVEEDLRAALLSEDPDPFEIGALESRLRQAADVQIR